jgi:hypothetical protein
MTSTKDRVSETANTVKPYVDRALRDEELRQSVRDAYQSARTVYDELIGRRGVVPAATRLATDSSLQDELKSAVADLRRAADRLQGKEEQRRSANGMLLLVGIAIGILFNPITGPQTRRWISGRLTGGGDGFTYEGSGNGTSS